MGAILQFLVNHEFKCIKCSKFPSRRKIAANGYRNLASYMWWQWVDPQNGTITSTEDNEIAIADEGWIFAVPCHSLWCVHADVFVQWPWAGWQFEEIRLSHMPDRSLNVASYSKIKHGRITTSWKNKKNLHKYINHCEQWNKKSTIRAPIQIINFFCQN